MKKKLFFCWIVGIFLIGTVFAQDTIVLKILGINPSKENKQKVVLKAYLPEEVKPEDIIDKSDLEIFYDPQKGSYYVYGEYELQPQETIERKVEIKDIWTVPQEEIDTLRSEAKKTLRLLENTDFKERANFLMENINSKLNEIIRRQKIPAVNPQTHISNYRDNLKLLESVKNDLLLARSLLAQARGIPSVTIWKVFLIVIAFLAVLGLSLYLIWQRQLKVITASGEEEISKEEVSVQKRGGKREEILPEEIERIIKGEKEE